MVKNLPSNAGDNGWIPGSHNLRFFKLSPKFGSELPGSSNEMRMGASFMSWIAHNQKPTSSSEDAELHQKLDPEIHSAPKSYSQHWLRQ